MIQLIAINYACVCVYLMMSTSQGLKLSISHCSPPHTASVTANNILLRLISHSLSNRSLSNFAQYLVTRSRTDGCKFFTSHVLSSMVKSLISRAESGSRQHSVFEHLSLSALYLLCLGVTSCRLGNCTGPTSSLSSLPPAYRY